MYSVKLGKSGRPDGIMRNVVRPIRMMNRVNRRTFGRLFKTLDMITGEKIDNGYRIASCNNGYI